MDLSSFLADDSLGGGSWADEEVDMNTIGIQSSTAAVPERSIPSGTNNFNESNHGFSDEPRRERIEHPIPDEPPFRARIANLPWDINEDDVAEFFMKRMQASDIITDVKLPAENGRLKGFGFVTFTEREVLEEALHLNTADFNGRRVYVNVAAPQRQDVFDVDWRAARTGPLSGGRRVDSGDRPRREEPDLDWGSARTEQVNLPPRERSRRGPPTGDRPRREEPDLDWGSARTEQVNLPPRERSRRGPPTGDRPRRDEPDLDWGSARTEQVNLPPRERSNRRSFKKTDDFDWGSARTEEVKLPPRERSNRKKNEPELDWNSARSDETKPARRNFSNRNNNKLADKEEEKSQGPQKSSYDVLAIEGESDEEKPEEKSTETVESVKTSEKVASTEGLEKATADLSVNDQEDGWEVVRK